MTEIDRGRLSEVLRAEEERFVATHRRSGELFEEAKGSLLAGVPMPWMTEWAGPLPGVRRERRGRPLHRRRRQRVRRPLPRRHRRDDRPRAGRDRRRDRRAGGGGDHPDAPDRGLRLGRRRSSSRRFGLPYWQFALTATDANRFTIRLARAITGRPKVLVYSWCYHGTVDETFAIAVDGATVSRPDNIGPPVDPSVTTVAIEWNDVEALEAALASGEIACVLAEPAMTNIGIVLPEPGYHDALRALTREHDTLLVIDETHTICAGPGGYTAAHDLEPDFVTIGKPLAAGVPAAAYGMSDEVADRVLEHERPARGLRRRRHRRHPLGQRALAGGDAGDAREGPHRGGLRADDRPRRAIRGRGPRGDRRPTTCPGT